MREKSQKAAREMRVERSDSNGRVKSPDVEGLVVNCREKAPPQGTVSLLETCAVQTKYVLGRPDALCPSDLCPLL